jgi:hypothetical protein
MGAPGGSDRPRYRLRGVASSRRSTPRGGAGCRHRLLRCRADCGAPPAAPVAGVAGEPGAAGLAGRGRSVRGRDRGVRAGSWCRCRALAGLRWARAGDGAQRLGELAEVGVWQPAGDVFAGDGGQDRAGLVQHVAACSAAMTALFVALLGWLFIETRDDSVLGLAERLTSSIQTCWPFIIAVALRRAGPRPAAHAQRERPAPRARSSLGYPADRPSAQIVPALPGRERTPPRGSAGAPNSRQIA